MSKKPRKPRTQPLPETVEAPEDGGSDAARRRVELNVSLDRKRFELLQMKKAQMAARQQSDPALEKQLVELASRLERYVAPITPPEPPKGLVTLKKKNADGAVVATSAAAR